MDVVVNYFAVVVAAVATIALGFVWYGPLFGRAWMHEMGFTPEKMEGMAAKGMHLTYILQAVGALVMAYVLAHVLGVSKQAFGMLDMSGAMMGAFWMWLGFIAPIMMGMVLWEGKSWWLFALQSGYYLAALEVMAVILALWR